jgi:hypothetical protein
MKCLIKFDVCIVQISLHVVSEPHMQHDAILDTDANFVPKSQLSASVSAGRWLARSLRPHSQKEFYTEN